MESTLGKMFEDLQKSTREEFFDLLHYVRVSQVKGSFFFVDQKKRGKIFGRRRDEMFRPIQNIAESTYQNYSRN